MKLTAEAFLSLSMVMWEAAVEKLGAEDRESLREALSRLAERATRASAYVGNHERSHRRRVVKQNRAAKAVRKALGFAYPDQPVTF